MKSFICVKHSWIYIDKNIHNKDAVDMTLWAVRDDIVFWKNNQLLDWYFVKPGKRASLLIERESESFLHGLTLGPKIYVQSLPNQGDCLPSKAPLPALLLTWVVFRPQDNEGSTISRCEADLMLHL